MLTLLGVVVVVVGFARRVNPLLVVLGAIAVTSLASGMQPVAIVAAIGKAFTANRYMAVGWLLLPLVGVLERAGLRERAQTLVRSIRAATAGRVLVAYFVLRQCAAALGLTALGGHAQMVRPLVAPMAEAAAERQLAARGRSLGDALRFHLRAHAAAADNIGLFFGEDIFIAIGSILLMKGFLKQNGIDVEPLDLAKWAVPTAIAALVIHVARLLRLDRTIARSGAEGEGRNDA
ncbi:MAG: DUF969 domain-containing protein [Labilithrix sp.]|nr:DUF969 domain-containing protein [Labilithrix sp.]MCW5816206.1 DUF969 domain-containing protein [Labilithrix sp.]